MNGVNRTHPSSGMIPIFGSGEYISIYEPFCTAEQEYTFSPRLETKARQFLDVLQQGWKLSSKNFAQGETFKSILKL